MRSFNPFYSSASFLCAPPLTTEATVASISPRCCQEVFYREILEVISAPQATEKALVPAVVNAATAANTFVRRERGFFHRRTEEGVLQRESANYGGITSAISFYVICRVSSSSTRCSCRVCVLRQLWRWRNFESNYFIKPHGFETGGLIIKKWVL